MNACDECFLLRFLFFLRLKYYVPAYLLEVTKTSKQLPIGCSPLAGDTLIINYNFKIKNNISQEQQAPSGVQLAPCGMQLGNFFWKFVWKSSLCSFKIFICSSFMLKKLAKALKSRSCFNLKISFFNSSFRDSIFSCLFKRSK